MKKPDLAVDYGYSLFRQRTATETSCWHLTITLLLLGWPRVTWVFVSLRREFHTTLALSRKWSVEKFRVWHGPWISSVRLSTLDLLILNEKNYIGIAFSFGIESIPSNLRFFYWFSDNFSFLKKITIRTIKSSFLWRWIGFSLILSWI